MFTVQCYCWYLQPSCEHTVNDVVLSLPCVWLVADLQSSWPADLKDEDLTWTTNSWEGQPIYRYVQSNTTLYAHIAAILK